MTFNEYQDEGMALAVYPKRGYNLLYPAMGLAGEAGETIDKVKKNWRNEDKTAAGQYTQEQIDALAKEVGDVLWYVSAMAYELGFTLEEIAKMNINKLRDRNARGVIKSEGDNR